mmetsp:Transcript_7412/g.30103  ORF Transcript_7412/g.30103 Transcript_7412/m.30103 type:complete len:218 (+) Transcript_7412:131-784(+)
MSRKPTEEGRSLAPSAPRAVAVARIGGECAGRACGERGAGVGAAWAAPHPALEAGPARCVEAAAVGRAWAPSSSPLRNMERPPFFGLRGCLRLEAGVPASAGSGRSARREATSRGAACDAGGDASAVPAEATRAAPAFAEGLAMPAESATTLDASAAGAAPPSAAESAASTPSTVVAFPLLRLRLFFRAAFETWGEALEAEALAVSCFPRWSNHAAS